MHAPRSCNRNQPVSSLSPPPPLPQQISWPIQPRRLVQLPLWPLNFHLRPVTRQLLVGPQLPFHHFLVVVCLAVGRLLWRRLWPLWNLKEKITLIKKTFSRLFEFSKMNLLLWKLGQHMNIIRLVISRSSHLNYTSNSIPDNGRTTCPVHAKTDQNDRELFHQIIIRDDMKFNQGFGSSSSVRENCIILFRT